MTVSHGTTQRAFQREKDVPVRRARRLRSATGDKEVKVLELREQMLTVIPYSGDRAPIGDAPRYNVQA